MKTAYLLFYRADKKNWGRFFMHDDMRHVRYLEDCGDYWLLLEGLNGHLKTRIFRYSFNLVSKLSDSATVCVRVDFKQHNDAKFRPGICFHLNCASVVGYILGMKKRILRPEGLYKEVIKSKEIKHKIL